ncbi:MAG: SAF domain-containing protein [Archangium sp.]|nr:SAF domain-containing protein [Archangium sp.]
MSTARPEQDRKASLLIVGAVVGACLGLVIGGGGTWLYTKREASLARKGWLLVPVVIAKRDLAPGTVLTMDDVDQRSVPEVIVNASIIKPDAVSYVINQPLLLPVAGGEPLRWAHVATWEKPLHPIDDGAAIDACTRQAAARLPPDLQRPDQIRARLERGRP